MRSKPPTSLLLVFSVVCFAIGITSVVLRRPGLSVLAPTPTPTAPGGGSDPSEFPRAVLFLGVDSLESPQPSLEAIWLAAYRPSAREVLLFGLPSDVPIGEEAPAPADERFTWQPGAGPEAEFLDSLQAWTLVPPELIVVLDRVGFSAVVDYAGGIDLNGVRITGEEVVAILDLWREDPAGRAETQARILQALVRQGPAIGTTPDLTELVTLIPAHAYLSGEVADAALLLAPLLPIDPSLVRISTLSEGPMTDPVPIPILTTSGPASDGFPR